MAQAGAREKNAMNQNLYRGLVSDWGKPARGADIIINKNHPH